MHREVPHHRWMSVRRWTTALVGACVVAAAVIVTALVVEKTHSIATGCVVGPAGNDYGLDTDQTQNAAIIAATAHRAGLPDHAVTVALAAAFQESKLRNLPYGDRDSVGLFQQRPSQGWGTPAELLDPIYASDAFYSRLRKISGWQTMPVADAVQRVQHSADGSAYAQWEDEGRALARALTGQAPATLSCQFPNRKHNSAAGFHAAVDRQLGSTALVDTPSQARGWAIASWVVANADAFGVHTVSYGSMRWTSTKTKWLPVTTATRTVRVTFFTAKS
jgi:hypothetical protein